MKKIRNKTLKILLLSLLIFLSLSLIKPTQSVAPIKTGEFETPIEDYLLYVQPPDRLLYYMEEKESAFKIKAYNKREHAAGILQIRPIMLRHVNSILEKQGDTLRFTLADRFDSTKSVKMYYIVQQNDNPQYDPKLAVYIWNGGLPIYKKKSHIYWLEIKRKLEKDSTYLRLLNANIKQNDIYKREL